MSARERIAYLKGLLDGLGPAREEGHNKIFGAVLDALDALVQEMEEHGEIIEEQKELYEDLADDCALLDEDLDALERAFAEYTGEGMSDEDDDMEDFDESYLSVTCPSCGYVFYYQPDEYEEGEELQCPSCGVNFDRQPPCEG